MRALLTFARPGGSNSQGVRFSGADGGSWVVLQNTSGYRVQASALDPDGGVYTVALDSNQLRWLAPNGTLQPGREIPDAGGFTNLLPTARGFLLVPKPENASVSVRLVPFAAAAPLVVSNSLAASSCGNPTATDTWRSATLLPSGEVLMLPSHPGFALTVSFPSDGGLHLSCAPGPSGEFVTKEGAVLAIPRVGDVAPFVGTSGSFITLPGGRRQLPRRNLVRRWPHRARARELEWPRVRHADRRQRRGHRSAHEPAVRQLVPGNHRHAPWSSADHPRRNERLDPRREPPAGAAARGPAQPLGQPPIGGLPFRRPRCLSTMGLFRNPVAFLVLAALFVPRSVWFGA